MPSSHHEQIPKIVWYACIQRPNTVLDIGFGFGKYGYLLREYLEIPSGRYDPADWQVRIDGIEAYAPYVQSFHRAIYNRIFIGEALAVMKDLPDQAYDLILAIDVLEAFHQRGRRPLYQRVSADWPERHGQYADSAWRTGRLGRQ